MPLGGFLGSAARGTGGPPRPQRRSNGRPPGDGVRGVSIRLYSVLWTEYFLTTTASNQTREEGSGSSETSHSNTAPRCNQPARLEPPGSPIPGSKRPTTLPVDGTSSRPRPGWRNAGDLRCILECRLPRHPPFSSCSQLRGCRIPPATSATTHQHQHQHGRHPNHLRGPQRQDSAPLAHPRCPPYRAPPPECSRPEPLGQYPGCRSGSRRRRKAETGLPAQGGRLVL